MKQLLLSTVIVGAASMAALAQTAATPPEAPADTMTQTPPVTDTAPVEGTAPADTMTADTATDAMLPLPEGYMAAGPEFMTTEALVGAPVHDANDEWIGSVTELVMDGNGQVTNAIVDVGGFLGIGAKPVSLTLQDMQVVRATEGEDLRIYVALTEEALEQLPTYEG